ncbi:hydantoinase/oxoprolinase family protein [Desulfosarcina ovata]|uniref:5-oxoprolinase n=1 Tax=Desulfosarcina ovata subsp. ovata TaxID=2752305 RepID=A0A5K8A3T7_9BACT|nr:hydantoinase/oxoprolinase family protein [Desulfosarcina ovata]BBO87212.1 5-oxoprolinase [Desulfosarcina ovata subsp. ovata]
MNYQVCIDIGGTFTDCLVSETENSGRISIFKSPTTPGNFEEGFINVLKVAAESYHQNFIEFIRQIKLIIHGSTVSTNALVERKVAKTGLILNSGHRHILVLREGPRKGAFEWKLNYPDPYIPEWLTFTVDGRIDARGNELVNLNETDVRNAIFSLQRRRVESIAVGLLWSVVNPKHELRVREIINEEWPDINVTLSHEINPLPSEYKRIIAATIDASINPIISRYIAKIVSKLKEVGFQGDLLMANCVGGMMPTQEMIRRPIYSVMSGPTLAPMAALSLTNEPDVIVGDMGGTTFDVSALRDHQLIVTPDSKIHDDSLGIPKVDVRSIGAGGGSLASVDDGGLLIVGPQSAGAVPGPACFDKGNEEPTVTDANVVLGLIDPDYFLGGQFKLRKELAEQAIKKIADRLNISTIEAAYAIYTTSNHNMVAAIEDITIREGINPRESYFVCGGGGTACHIAEMVEILGLTKYMIPCFMAGLSAFGGLISDLRWETSRALQTDHRHFKYDQVNELLTLLHKEADAFLAGARVEPEMRQYEYAFFGRYEYQSWEIEVAFETPVEGINTDDLENLVDRFHEMHERIYSIRNPDDLVEFTRWRVRAIGKRKNQDDWRSFYLKPHAGELVPKSHRPVYVHQGKSGNMVSLPVYEISSFGSGAKITHPSIIESETYTAYLRPGHHAEVDQHGNLLVEVH